MLSTIKFHKYLYTMSTVNRKTKLLVLSSCFLFMMACQDDEPEAMNVTQYSGLWKGLISKVKTGSCNTSSTPDSTRLLFFVLSDGSFTAQQEWKHAVSGVWSTIPTTSWSGTISNNDDINLHKTYTAICFGVGTPGEAHYSGKIVKTSNTATLSIESDEAWCPGEGCTFKVSYALQRGL